MNISICTKRITETINESTSPLTFCMGASNLSLIELQLQAKPREYNIKRVNVFAWTKNEMLNSAKIQSRRNQTFTDDYDF